MWPERLEKMGWINECHCFDASKIFDGDYSNTSHLNSQPSVCQQMRCALLRRDTEPAKICRRVHSLKSVRVKL